MTANRHILLLAGAGEGRDIAERLQGDARFRVTASEHVPDRTHGPLPVSGRTGGFGGAQGFQDYLESANIDAVVDATHPFAHRMSARTAALCAQSGIAYLQVLRAPWVPGPGEVWTEVADEAAAAALIRPGERVFTTTGRAALGGFARLAPDCLCVRQIRPGQLPQGFEGAHQICDSGPFSVEDELETFRRLSIDVLVARNTGGEVSRTKLDAARILGLRVILIARPPLLEVARVGTSDAAMKWLEML